MWVTTTPVPTNPPTPLFPGRAETQVQAYNAAALALFKQPRWAARVEICDLHAWVTAKCGTVYSTCPIQKPSNPHYTSDGWLYLGQKVAACVRGKGL